jgi:hypothetical protein
MLDMGGVTQVNQKMVMVCEEEEGEEKEYSSK